MKLKNYLVINLAFLSLIVCFTACSNDDDSVNEEKIQVDAKKEDLEGIWSIFQIESNGNTSNVPINFENCGRDFFIYNNNNTYEEFIFQESFTCRPSTNQLKWNLNQGVIKLSDIENDENFELITINSLSKDRFVFTARLDLTGNNEKESYKLTALKYLPPNELDIYTSSFMRREGNAFINHIEFIWEQYNGYNNFEKYEILRSTSSCNLNDAKLITIINDKNVTSFIDNEPPTESNEVCYFLKIYTDKGLLGTSDPRYIQLEYLKPKSVFFNGSSSSWQENKVRLEWEKYKGHYFSHYEIVVRDQNVHSHLEPKGISKIIIDDINTTSFTDLNPPYVNNPVYTIYAYNIFGNTSELDREKSRITVDLIRPDILNFNYIRFLAFDKEDHSFFFYANVPDGNTFKFRLIKYDYLKKEIITEAFKLPSSWTDTGVKIIDSSEYGKEFIFPQSSELWVYDTSNLNFKYSLKKDFFGSIDSYDYLGNNIWITSDDDKIYTLLRDEDKLTKIDEKPHFTEHQGGFNYEVTVLDQNNILLSHNNEGRAIHYEISHTGLIQNKGIKQMPLYTRHTNDEISINSDKSLILNSSRNSVYDTENFNLFYTLPESFVASNFNNTGDKIIGTNNQTGIDNFDLNFKKEIVVYDLSQNTFVTKEAKGYSLLSFEDSLGNIISLSSGEPRNSYYSPHTGNKPDFFIEVIE